MVLELSTAFAMRCPICGRLDINQINVFQLSGESCHKIYCECGSQNVTIRRKGPDYIRINYFCIICDHQHFVVIPKRKFWSSNHLNTLICLDTNLNLGYYGSYKLLKKELDRQQKELNSMADDLGFDDFDDPELMLDALDYLHDIAAGGSLLCECGSHEINIELFSDRVELTCNNCQASFIVPAASREDLNKLKSSDEVILRFPAGKSKKSKGPWINI